MNKNTFLLVIVNNTNLYFKNHNDFVRYVKDNNCGWSKVHHDEVTQSYTVYGKQIPHPVNSAKVHYSFVTSYTYRICKFN